MAKKNWQDNDHITPAFLNGFFGVDGSTGHIHDGDDADYSAPKVVLTGGNNVSGELPRYYLEGYESGSVAVKITTAHLTVEQTGYLYWEKFGSYTKVLFPEMTGTSNSVNLEIALQFGQWPTGFTPSAGNTILLPIILYDNSSQVPGVFNWVVSPTSVMSFGALNTGVFDLNNFTNTNIKGVSRCVLTWGSL